MPVPIISLKPVIGAGRSLGSGREIARRQKCSVSERRAYIATPATSRAESLAVRRDGGLGSTAARCVHQGASVGRIPSVLPRLDPLLHIGHAPLGNLTIGLDSVFVVQSALIVDGEQLCRCEHGRAPCRSLFGRASTSTASRAHDVHIWESIREPSRTTKL